jgi:hypothetical protein
MLDKIRQEIKTMEESAERLKSLGVDMPAIRRNAEVILTFLYVLKFITPVVENKEG